MTTAEVALLPAGTKVYWLKNLCIQSYWVIGLHPKSSNTLVLGNTLSVSTVETIHLPHERRDWYLDYEEAAEAMWAANMVNMHTLNQIYFDGAKTITPLTNP